MAIELYSDLDRSVNLHNIIIMSKKCPKKGDWHINAHECLNSYIYVIWRNKPSTEIVFFFNLSPMRVKYSLEYSQANNLTIYGDACFIRFWQQGEKYVSKPEDRLYDLGMT